MSAAKAAADYSEMGPWDTPEVHHGERPDHQHQCGAEVRLQEDKGGRSQSEPDNGWSVDRRAASGTIDDEAREGQDE